MSILGLFKRKYKVWASVEWLDRRGVTKSKHLEIVSKNGIVSVLRTEVDGKTIQIKVKVK